MALKLVHPAAEPAAASGLSLDDIERLHQQIDAFVDGLVAQERVRCPGVPAEALRMTLLRGQCRCTAATRLLEQQE